MCSSIHLLDYPSISWKHRLILCDTAEGGYTVGEATTN